MDKLPSRPTMSQKLEFLDLVSNLVLKSSNVNGEMYRDEILEEPLPGDTMDRMSVSPILHIHITVQTP